MVEIVAAVNSARVIVRTANPAMAELPVEPCRSNTVGARSALWLGPDEWLLLVPNAEAEIAKLAAGFASEAYAAVDVSHRQLALRVVGPDAADVLNGSVPLDLSLAAFPPGMCTRTICEKAEIVLWRISAETWHIEVARSFAPYVRALLEHTALLSVA